MNNTNKAAETMNVYVVMMSRVLDGDTAGPEIKVFASKENALAYYHKLVDACDALVNDEHPNWSIGYSHENEKTPDCIWSRYKEYDYNVNHIDVTLDMHEVK